MSQQWVAILLAGAIHPSPLTRRLGMPPVCLPIGQDGTLLDAWVRVIETAGGCREVRLVVNNQREADRVSEAITMETSLAISVCVDPSSWRGTAGIVHDVSGERPVGDGALVIEANCLPPDSLTGLFDVMQQDIDGVVGITSGHEPAGVSYFRKHLIDGIRPVGFVDLKEQWIPNLYATGHRIQTAVISNRLVRVRNRSGYLRALEESLGHDVQFQDATQQSTSQSAGPHERIRGASRIQNRARIADDALVDSSVVLDGAVVESGAVLSRCIVGRNAVVPAQMRVIDEVIASHASDSYGGRSEPAPPPEGLWTANVKEKTVQ